MPAEAIANLSNRMSQSQNPAVKNFAAPLLKASQSSDQKRAAILYGLYQQPAFREVYEDLGSEMVDTVLPVGTEREEN